MYNHFKKEINKAANEHIPITKINIDPEKHFKPKVYWNPSLSKIVAQHRLALKIFRRNPTPLNLTKLQEKVAESRKMIREAKFNNWKKFCNSFDETTNTSVLWNKMRWIKGLKSNKFYPTEEKLKDLLNNLATVSVLPRMPEFS
ncbi:unnamed protein product [Parnassius apollo]|uniref:(apollo) hypothetical protein n=1 Tax=Parnassius apollo TaxID=110799 RepID=A0A8S3WBU3_PARAO|nr:unnamed protein product [Parnassius apollo]